MTAYPGNHQTSVLFIFGNGGPDQDKVEEESVQYGDIIQVESLVDNYSNLSLKTAYTLKFFNDESKFKFAWGYNFCY